jgi:hypothetical protein
VPLDPTIRRAGWLASSDCGLLVLSPNAPRFRPATLWRARRLDDDAAQIHARIHAI